MRCRVLPFSGVAKLCLWAQGTRTGDSSFLVWALAASAIYVVIAAVLFGAAVVTVSVRSRRADSTMKQSIAVTTGRMLLMLFVFLMVGSSGVFAQTDDAVRRANRPAAIWAAGPLEVVAAFPEPVSPDRAKALIGQSIAYFDFIEPDKSDGSVARREPRPPGTKEGGLANRQVGALRIVGVDLGDSGRTLTIATDPHPRMGRYVLPIGASRRARPRKRKRDRRPHTISAESNGDGGRLRRIPATSRGQRAGGRRSIWKRPGARRKARGRTKNAWHSFRNRDGWCSARK